MKIVAGRNSMRRTAPGSLALLALAAALLVPASPAHAGRRYTVWAYPPGAGPKGSVEAETWITAERETRDSGTDVEYRIELENGITDGLSIDVYLAVLKQPAGGPASFDKVQVALRTDLMKERLKDAIDLTGYFEIKRDVDFGNPWEFEAIFIGGKSYGRFFYDFNLVYEAELSSSAFQKGSRELKGILGAGWELSPRLFAGGEIVAVNDAGPRELSIGPTISFTFTPSTWLAVGPQFGLNDRTDQLQVRALFGIFF
jgi:hypothetical protein